MDMSSADKPASLLESILHTLEKINQNIVQQDKRWDRIEGILGKGSYSLHNTQCGGAECDLVGGNASSDVAKRANLMKKHEDSASKSLKESPKTAEVVIATIPTGLDKSLLPDSKPVADCTDSSSTQCVIVEPQAHDGVRPVEAKTEQQGSHIIDYSDWRSALKNSPLHKHLFLRESLGDAWTIPEDGRIPLSFSREALEGLNLDDLQSTVSYISKFRQRMDRCKDICFHVVDYDKVGGNIIYRLGKDASIGKRGLCSMPEAPVVIDAPWRRFIFCQGLNTAQETDLDSAARKAAIGCWDEAPFLLQRDIFNTRNYYLTALDHHIRCLGKHRGASNRYETAWGSFHITFYEAPSVSTPQITKDLPRGGWQYGSLYGSNDLEFCESALTLITVPSTCDRPYRSPTHPLESWKDYTLHRSYVCSDWTIMLLAPLSFFDSSYHLPKLGPDDFQGALGFRSMEGATLCLLKETYDRLQYNWRLFKMHFETLLDEGGALMNPAMHDALLWDDETFSRSRKYAWAINCLVEFERSIGDNIMQWKNFKSARLDHLINARILSVKNIETIEDIEDRCRTLAGIQQYFSMKLNSTKALRDGLFNASAVIESRASTRLGENIRLLTFVSIFFLPLTFCTSLWSINNLFSSTALIFTSIIVGISTYIMVFNLNSVVQWTSSLYTPIREDLIFQMKHDNKDNWSSRGKHFSAFRPRHERQKPSEWWIMLFCLYSIIQSLRSLLPNKRHPSETTIQSSSKVIVLGRSDDTSCEVTGISVASKTAPQNSIKSLTSDASLSASEKTTPKASFITKVISFPPRVMRRGKSDNIEPIMHQDV